MNEIMKDTKLRKSNPWILLALSIIIAVLCVLYFFILPGIKKSQHERNLNLCVDNLKTLSIKLDNYYRKEGKYPPTLDKLIPDYTKKIPECPETHKDQYSAGYEVSDDGQVFTLFCWGNVHKDIGIPPNFPAYFSKEGIVRKK